MEDAGRESQRAVKSRIQPKIGAPRIIIFEKSKTIVAPTTIMSHGLCVTPHNNLPSESTLGPALAAEYFLSAMAAWPSAEETRNMEAVTNPLRMQQGGNGGAKRRRFPRVA